jgi:hypothetical protein
VWDNPERLETTQTRFGYLYWHPEFRNGNKIFHVVYYAYQKIFNENTKITGYKTQKYGD